MAQEIILIPVIFFFLAIHIVIGVYLWRKEIGIDTYFVNERKTKTFLLVLTSMSTAIGGGTIFTLMQLGYVQGLSAIIVCAAMGGGLILASLVGGKIHEIGKAENLFTLPEFLEKKFDYKTKAIAIVVNLISYIFLAALQILALTTLGTIFIGLNFKIALFISWFLVIAYTYMGGLIADILTDAIQFIFIFPIIFILFYFTIKFSGGIQILKTLDFAPLAGSETINPILLVVLALFSWMPSILGSMDLWQRIYAADSKETARKFLFASGNFLFFILFLFSFVGVLFRASSIAVDAGSTLIPAKIISAVPPIFSVILLLGLLAALMSTADSMLMVLSATWTHDIYKSWKKVKDNNVLLRHGRISVVVFGLLSALIAWKFANFVLLLGTALSSLAILTPAILGGLYYKKPKPKAAFYSILAGFTIIIFAIFMSLIGKNTTLVTLAQIFAFIISFTVFFSIKK